MGTKIKECGPLRIMYEFEDGELNIEGGLQQGIFCWNW